MPSKATIFIMLTHSYELLEGIDLCSAGIMTVPLEEGEEVTGKESVELQEQVVDADIQMQHQLVRSQAWRGREKQG